MKKIIIIGLDGACLDILMPWIEQGFLPQMSSLFRRGVYSELTTIIPPVTPPAWTSLVTGKNPGKHGITWGFFKPKDNSYETTTISALDNKAKCIWDYLTEHNMSSIVINVPVTHPAKKIKGILIPGFMAPPNPVCYHPNILDDFQRANGRRYRVYGDADFTDLGAEKALQDYIDLTMMRKRAALYFAQKYEWEFLMVEFQKTDEVFHAFGDAKYENLRLRLYQCVDECVGDIVHVLGKDANVFLVSDHGMGESRWHCCLNTWLKEQGFLTYMRGATAKVDTLLTVMKGTMDENVDTAPIAHKPTRATTPKKELAMRYLGKLGITLEAVDEIMTKLHLTFLEKIVPKTLGHMVWRKQIDWKKTMVYCPSPDGGVRINLKDRDPEGIVAPGQQYENLRQELIKRLRCLTTPGGELAFEHVLPQEEVYHGSQTGNASDILLVPSAGGCGVRFHDFGPVFRPSLEYTHKMYGLFAAMGEDIASVGYLQGEKSIMDIAPTVLHSLGLAVPKDMDGRVLTEIFIESSGQARRPVEYKEDDRIEKLNDKIRRLKRSGRI